MRGFYIRAPFATIAVFDAVLQRIADLLRDLGDTDDVEGRRVKALLVLSRPERAAELLTGPKPAIDWEALLPQVVVNVHVYAGADDDGIARVERCGVMTLAWVKEHLSSHAKVTVRPVLDIEGQAPADAYEIPDRHRQAVRLMTPADTFPFSSSLDPDQLDHTVPFTRGPDTVGAGQSRVGNYGPMSTPHHRVKTHGRWAVQQPFPGIYVWRDPHGAFYLVGHTGTRRLPKAA